MALTPEERAYANVISMLSAYEVLGSQISQDIVFVRINEDDTETTISYPNIKKFQTETKSLVDEFINNGKTERNDLIAKVEKAYTDHVQKVDNDYGGFTQSVADAAVDATNIKQVDGKFFDKDDNELTVGKSTEEVVSDIGMKLTEAGVVDKNGIALVFEGKTILDTVPSTLIASESFYIRGSGYTRQGSTTYQSFMPLSKKGVFAGLFDSYGTADSNGGVFAKAFLVDQETGALTIQAKSDVYTHDDGATFSTCHFNSAGMDVMNIGNNLNPTDGNTARRGFAYAARFNDDGTVADTAHREAGADMRPHSNGSAIATKDGNKTFFRRSNYHGGDSKYEHTCMSYDGSSIALDESVDPTASTSTNYCMPSVRQYGAESSIGGIVLWYKDSIGKVTAVNNAGDRGSDYNTTDMFGANPTSSFKGFDLSNGKTIWGKNGRLFVQEGNALTSVDGTNGLGIIYQGEYQSNKVPIGVDKWLVPVSSYGFAILTINPDTYETTISKQMSIMALPGETSPTPQHSGRTLQVTGSENQFIVHAYVTSGQATVTVWDNPLKGDM